MTLFDVAIETSGQSATVHLSGELDVSTAPVLRDRIVHLVSEGRTHLIFECANLEFIDSTGLGVLIGARTRALAANGSVAIDAAKPALRRLLAVTGIDGLFPEHTTV